MQRVAAAVFTRAVRILWGKNLSRFRPVHKSFQFLYERLRRTDPVLVEIEGSRLYVDPRGMELPIWSFARQLSSGVYKEVMTAVFRKEVKLGMTVIDLGAHIGYFTLLASKLVGDKGRVIALEPSPGNYDLLVKNIAINGVKNVVPLQKAVSDRAGYGRLVLCAHDTAADAMYSSSGDDDRSVTVECLPLDDLLPDDDAGVDFIKMNVEGVEMAALRGMSRVIERNPNLKIVTEFHPVMLRRGGSSPEEFLAALGRYGFRFYDIDEKQGVVRPCHADSLLAAYAEFDGWQPPNLLCVR